MVSIELEKAMLMSMGGLLNENPNYWELMGFLQKMG